MNLMSRADWVGEFRITTLLSTVHRQKFNMEPETKKWFPKRNLFLEFEFGDDFVAGFMLSFRGAKKDVWDFNSSFFSRKMFQFLVWLCLFSVASLLLVSGRVRQPQTENGSNRLGYCLGESHRIRFVFAWGELRKGWGITRLQARNLQVTNSDVDPYQLRHHPWLFGSPKWRSCWRKKGRKGHWKKLPKFGSQPEERGDSFHIWWDCHPQVCDIGVREVTFLSDSENFAAPV